MQGQRGVQTGSGTCKGQTCCQKTMQVTHVEHGRLLTCQTRRSAFESLSLETLQALRHCVALFHLPIAMAAPLNPSAHRELRRAAAYGLYDVVVACITHLHADPTFSDESGETPLHHAARGGHLEARLTTKQHVLFTCSVVRLFKLECRRRCTALTRPRR